MNKRELAEQIERLQGDVNFYRNMSEVLRSLNGVTDAIAKIKREYGLETTVDAEDAQRYRWLRSESAGDEGMPFICVISNGYTGQLDGVAADEAIDAAMNEQK